MRSQSNWMGTLALVLSTSAWAGLFLVGKATLATIDPVWFSVLRYVGATLMLAALLCLNGPVRWAALRRHWRRLLGYGLLGYVMFGLLVFVGLDHSLPSHGAVIMATMPVSALMLRWAIERQRLQWWAWLVLGLTLSGVILVSGLSIHALGTPSIWGGDALALLGSLGWVFYTRGQARLTTLSVLEYTGFTAMLATPVLVAIALTATWFGWAHMPGAVQLTQVAPAMAYVVIVATVFAALAFNQGVRQLGAVQGIVYINLVPVLTLAMSAWRGARPGAAELFGALLVIAALSVQATMSRAPRAV